MTEASTSTLFTVDYPIWLHTNLVELKEGVIVSRAAIRKVERCGNCTVVELFGTEEFTFRHYQIWDEDKELWNRLRMGAT